MIPQVQALLIAWSYIKKYAWIFFAVISAILLFVLLRKGQPNELALQIEAIKKRHEEEIKAIQEADTKRLQDYEENQKKLQQALALLDEKYRKQIDNLDEQKKVEINKILLENGDNPKILAEMLAKQLDLQVKNY